MIAPATLPSLLCAVLGGLEQAYIAEGAGSDRTPSLDQWANLLRTLDSAGTDSRRLPTILRLSKRAVRSRVSAAIRNGWIEELKFGRGQATVRLTPRGSDVADRWRSLQEFAEERWRVEIGIDRERQLRACLQKVVALLPLEHPHYPASYGMADASITGRNGQDCKAVPRKGGDTVSNLPLSALVSELLVAFAMNYEEKSQVALSLSAMVIRHIPPEGRPLNGLGYPVGISALERHGFVRVSGGTGGEFVYLTPKGFAVSEAYDERIQAVEAEWRNGFGNEPVVALRRALEDVVATAGRAKRAAG